MQYDQIFFAQKVSDFFALLLLLSVHAYFYVSQSVFGLIIYYCTCKVWKNQFFLSFCKMFKTLALKVHQ